MSERPSQQKVRGVSDKFLAYSEREMAAVADWIRFNEEELDVFEASRIGYVLGFSAIRSLAGLPFQKMRAGFLEHAREVEGRRPGEETIAAFALNHCSRPARYPMSVRQIQNPLQ